MFFEASLRDNIDLNFRDSTWPNGDLRYARIEGGPDNAELRKALWAHRYVNLI